MFASALLLLIRRIMLVCPQCQLENANHYKFCQQCGTSLTHQICHKCTKSVPLNTATCPECEALIGTIWQAILAQTIDDPQNNTSVEEIPSSQQLTLYGDYLDAGQKYQLWTQNKETALQTIALTDTQKLYRGQVVDCQPLQKSVLKVLLTQSPNLTSSPQNESSSSIWQQIGLPNLALPYLSFPDLYPIIPEVHDAWIEEETEVILLPDRTHWQVLSTLLIEESLPILQIIYWFKQMVTLWKSLATVNCRQSLLIDDNLRVDEDQMFGIGQLYPDIPHKPPALKNLGKLWQKWLTQTKYPPGTSLMTLVTKVAQGEIENLTDLRLELQDLATEQQGISEDNPTQEGASSDVPQNLPQDNLSILPDFSEDLLDMSSDEPLTIGERGHDLPTAVLPLELLSLDEAGCTDKGRQRHHNEDYFGINTEVHKQETNQGKNLEGRGLYIVCDGMGGHAAGEVASKMAVESLQEFFAKHWTEDFPTQETILQGILLANQSLYDVNQKNSSSGSGRMGTTLVLVSVKDTQVAIAHVGDSRVYRLSRKGGLEQLTVDHEVGQKAIQRGIDPEIAYGRPDAYQLTQALGPHDNNYVQPDIRFLELYEDTLLLLCSDGLSDNDLIEDHWQTYLSPLLSSSQNLEQGLHKLIEFANRYNGHDNITAVLVRVKVRPQSSFNDW
ncbi:serine/threonine phosphatase [Aphanothece sacrum]|uniref:Protein phosphatase n=1 Tax=Aphanothece sacrum FPU1 TaxID=1920663 RepID=A0A401IE34_APHSA|nr:serine/threonine phosphatase [Aphanothece sacrum]GBF79538.1 protein phosphatase [Aphanothece sacrum FPU1]GBF83922.1 protein phosphatase [Aphanothece sacrum FPU3]